MHLRIDEPPKFCGHLDASHVRCLKLAAPPDVPSRAASLLSSHFLRLTFALVLLYVPFALSVCARLAGEIATLCASSSLACPGTDALLHISKCMSS